MCIIASIYTPTNSVNTENLTSTKLTEYIIGKQYKWVCVEWMKLLGF